MKIYRLYKALSVDSEGKMINSPDFKFTEVRTEIAPGVSARYYFEDINEADAVRVILQEKDNTHYYKVNGEYYQKMRLG